MKLEPASCVEWETQQTLSRRVFLKRTVALGALAALSPSPGAILGASAGGTSVEPVEAELSGPSRGPWRRLFLDATVVEEQQNLVRVFHAAEKHPANPVLRRDRPWEAVSAITGPYVYGTVFREGGKFRLWYEVHNKGSHTGYAESADGLNWTKPNLGLINVAGSKQNNLVISGFDRPATGGVCHNPSVIRCPDPGDPGRRYALFGFDREAGARVAFSPDGLRWRFTPETASKPLFSSSDVVNFFYDPLLQRYAATWKTRNRRGRAVGVAWSKDGLHWSKPFDGPVFVADDLDPDATQIYGMPVFPYQGLYIGLPWIYLARYIKYGGYSTQRMYEAQEDSPRAMEVQLAWSWDLANWTRPPERAQFIPRSPGQWDGGMIVTARAPVLVGDQLWFYYGGCDGFHDDPRVNAAIGLATLRLDGFCSMRAGATEGMFISRREPARQPLVTINARTRADGYVVAELLDRKNRVIAAFRAPSADLLAAMRCGTNCVGRARSFPATKRPPTTRSGSGSRTPTCSPICPGDWTRINPTSPRNTRLEPERSGPVARKRPQPFHCGDSGAPPNQRKICSAAPCEAVESTLWSANQKVFPPRYPGQFRRNQNRTRGQGTSGSTSPAR